MDQSFPTPMIRMIISPPSLQHRPSNCECAVAPPSLFVRDSLHCLWTSGVVLGDTTMAEAPPADQPVQQLESAQPLELEEGSIQRCSGYLTRRTKILKRWKKGWISVDPGNGGRRAPLKEVQIDLHVTDSVSVYSSLFTAKTVIQFHMLI